MFSTWTSLFFTFSITKFLLYIMIMGAHASIVQGLASPVVDGIILYKNGYQIYPIQGVNTFLNFPN